MGEQPQHEAPIGDFKTCTKCGKSLAVDQFRTYRTRPNFEIRFRARCKTCANAHTRGYKAQNPEKFKEAQRKQWRKMTDEQKAKYNASNLARRIEKMPDYYVLGVLASNTGISPKALREVENIGEFIEVKRSQIQLLRESKRRIKGNEQ